MLKQILKISMLIMGVCINFLNAHSQKNNSIQILAVPYTFNFGDGDNSTVEVNSPENIYVEYEKFSSPEFGLAYKHQFENGWGINSGISLQQTKQRMLLAVRPPMSGEHRFSGYLTNRFLNLRIGTSYKLTDKIELGFLVSLGSRFPNWGSKQFPNNISETSQHMHSTVTVVTPDSTYQYVSFSTDITIKYDRMWNNPITPEITASFNLVQNLNLQLGFRWKFWNIYNSAYFESTVTGFFKPEDAGNNQILHQSKLKQRDVSCYFALTYDIPLKRKLIK